MSTPASSPTSRRRLRLHARRSSSSSSRTRSPSRAALGASDAGGRGLRRRRPVGLGAQGRDRERRAQPRQVDRRHGLRRPAARQRQHLGLLARRARADGARGLRHRALHRRGPGRRPARRGRPGHAATPRERDLDLFHPWADRRRAGGRDRAALRGRGASRSTAASPIPKAPACRRSSRTSSPATAAASAAATRVRAIRCRSRRSPRCPAGAATTCSATPGTARCARRDDLAAPEAVGPLRRRARAVAPERRARSRPARCRCCSSRRSRPGLLGAYVQATSGGALYRKSSFLLDSLGQQVLPAAHRHPRGPAHARAARAARRSTTKAWRRAPRDVVSAGVVQGYFLSSYSARKLGMRTTGHAGGSQNLTLTSRLHAARRRPRRDAAQAAAAACS